MKRQTLATLALNALTVYYNENDPKAAVWLRELIFNELIPEGYVDERSITEVKAKDLDGFSQHHFFAGIGGWSYALRLAGWPDDRPVWTGSCPCQPFSAAGQRRGTADERHLWPEFRRLIAERSPPAVFGEQVASKDGREWLAGVRADLEALGYAVGAADLCAAAAGAPQIRQRLFWLAGAECSERRQSTLAREPVSFKETADIFGDSGQLVHNNFWFDADWLQFTDGKARRVEPGTFPLAHGVPARVGRLRGYGNAIVPQVAAEFIVASGLLDV